MRLSLVALALASPALAETPLTAAEFQAHIGQNTIGYEYSNGVRGTADYGPDRTLLWAFEDETCFAGTWFDRGNEICFAYADGTLSACWHFFMNGDRLRGTATYLSSGSPLDLELFEVAHTDQPLRCAGPDVGV
ncbi:MAG: hypothetical protein ACKO1H_10365 [Tabrizicola sp.]